MARFNIGALTRELQRYFFTGPGLRPVQQVVDDPESMFNVATPRNLLILLDDLASLTDAIDERMTEAEIVLQPGGPGGPIEVPVEHSLRADLEAWKIRLAYYVEIANEAPANDRIAVFEPVTLPLLIGFYPGDPVQKPIDAMTPYMIANGLKVELDWRKERLRLFFGDLWDNAADVFKGAGDAALNPLRFLTSGDILWAIGIGFGIILAINLLRK